MVMSDEQPVKGVGMSTHDKASLLRKVEDFANRIGLPQGRYSLVVERNKMATVRKRIINWMLVELERRYEDYGDRPANRQELRSLFKMSTIDGFPEKNLLTHKSLSSARRDVWGEFTEWWHGSLASEESEVERTALIRKYASTYGYKPDEFMHAYFEIRRNIRHGTQSNSTILTDDDVKFLESVARRSLDTNWRR